MSWRAKVCVLALASASIASCGDDDGPRDVPDTGGADVGESDAASDRDSARDDGATEDATAPPAVLDDDLTPDPMQITGCRRDPVARGDVYAKAIECDEERVLGELATGRPGDIVLRNAFAAYVVRRATDSEALIGGPGGGIVDAAAAGREDVLKELVTVIGLSAFGPSATSEIAITQSGGDGSATVRVVVEPQALEVLKQYVPALRPPPVRAVIDYRLDALDPALHVTIHAVSTRNVSVAPGLAVLLGGGGIGTAEGSVVLPVLDATAATDATSLLFEGLGDRTALGLSMRVASEIFRIDSLHLVTAPTVSVTATEIAEIAIDVAAAGSVAEARAALRASAGGVDDDAFDATIASSGARTLFGIERASDGAAVMWTRGDASGAVHARLPAGDYRVRTALENQPFFPGDSVTMLRGAAGAMVGVDAPSLPHGVIRVDAVADGEVAPVRVTVARDGVAPTSDDALRETAIGPIEIDVPAGRHRVVVSRGPEHDVHDVEVDVADGEAVDVTADLPRVVDTTGWVSCDFHLHTELSTDSSHRVLHALRQMAGEGIDVVSSTDHDYVTSYPALVARAGIADWLLTVAGDELTTSEYGHFGGYPMAYDPTRGANGAPVWFGMTPREVFDALRGAGEGGRDAIVQVNHPRLDRGFFGYVALDPATGHATADPAALGLPEGTDLDDFAFDVVEVWNGFTRGNNEESFEDWLGLRAAGRVFTMVGNSDSHRTGKPPGSPRTFVRVPDDARGAFDWDDVEASLRAGRATVCGGIFVTIEGPGGEGPGETVTASGPTVDAHVRVQAPPWIEVDRLRIYRGRELVVDRPITESVETVRFDETIAIDVTDDTFVVARVDGERDAEPLWDGEPFGVTNALAIEVP